jgi:hypothetical protein
MAKSTKCQNFYFKVVFHHEIGKEEVIDVISEFMKEIAKTHLSADIPFYDEVGDAWIIPINCCLLRSMPCAECLWSMYIYTSNTTFNEIKEITFVDETAVWYKNPIPFYPCRGMAVS